MEESYIPVSHISAPTPSSSTPSQLPPEKKRRKRGKRAKGRSETATDPGTPTPPPTPQEVARRHAQAKRAFQARRAGINNSSITSTSLPPSQPSTPSATAPAVPQTAVKRASAKDRLGPQRQLFHTRHLRPGQRDGLAAAAALEATDPGRAERVAARWREEMKKRQTTTTTAPAAARRVIPTPAPRPSKLQPTPAPRLQLNVRKPWKLHFAMEDLLEAEAKEASEPGCHGHEIERCRRWCNAIRKDEDSDDTDDDYRPPNERRQRRREKENDLMGWEDETPFPDDNAAADYIDANDILV